MSPVKEDFISFLLSMICLKINFLNSAKREAVKKFLESFHLIRDVCKKKSRVSLMTRIIFYPLFRNHFLNSPCCFD